MRLKIKGLLTAFCRSCTALFFQMSLINHDCLPNTRSVTFENPDMSLSLAIYASTDIWKGQCITQQYVPVTKGTNVRRKALKEWYFSCSCKRCSDPTEFGTYFSCLGCKKCDGYICPMDPLDEYSQWKCANCDMNLTSLDVERIVSQAETELQQNDHRLSSFDSALDNLISNKFIHIHHYIAINAQYDFLRRLVNTLNSNEDQVVLRRGVKYCKNILSVVNVLCPGYSYYRGVILYLLANCLFSIYQLDKNLKEVGCDIETLKEIMQEGIEIMEVEPEGSSYREMSNELESYKQALSKN